MKNCSRLSTDLETKLIAAQEMPQTRYHQRLSTVPYIFNFRSTICCIIFVIFFIVLIANVKKDTWSIVESEPLSRNKIRVHQKTEGQTIRYEDFNYLKPETLTYINKTYENNVQILYRLPKRKPVKAVLLIFHGCGRTQYEWFYTAERQRIIGGAVDLGYACLVFKATDTESRCWVSDTYLERNPDVQMVVRGLKSFYQENPTLESLPRFTFGASSGGVFSSIFVLNQQYKVQGQILFISIMSPYLSNDQITRKTYPSTVWIYMPRDTHFASKARIEASIKIFKEQNIPFKTFEIHPISLTESTIHERIPTISLDTSFFIYNRLKKEKWLDENDRLLYNPREKRTWERFFFPTINKKKSDPIQQNLNAHRSVLLDFLNTIYAEHEISFEHSYEALQWLQNGPISFGKISH